MTDTVSYPDYWTPDSHQALTPEFIEARHADVAQRVSKKRLHHIEGVAQTAEALARRYDLDPTAAYLAGILHDWDKGYNDAEIEARATDLNLQATLDAKTLAIPRILHGHTAAAALASQYPQIPSEVLQAVARHTTADLAMDDLDKLIYIADALEPGRTSSAVDELRDAVETLSLDELYYRVYQYWILVVIERGQALAPDTIDIWNRLCAQRAQRREFRS